MGCGPSLEGRGSLCTASREVDSWAQLCLCDAGAQVTLSSPNFSVCTCEWRDYLLKEISGRQKHRGSTTKNRECRGGQEETRAHPGVSAASPSGTMCPPLLLCPPAALLWGFFSSTCSSSTRAPSGAPGGGPFAPLFFLLSAFAARHRDLPCTPQPCSWGEST